MWKVNPDGGQELQVLDAGRMPFVSTMAVGSFTVATSGIYFIGPPDSASRTAPLELYRFADRRTVELARFDKPLWWYLGVSPDEKWLVYTQLDSSVDDLVLVENFR